MAERLLWRSASRQHDWWDRGFPSELLQTAAARQIIGRADWIEVRGKTAQMDPPLDADQLAPHLFEKLGRSSSPAIIRAGGSAPHEWELFVVLFKFDPQKDLADGYSLITIYFDEAKFETAETASHLVAAFMSVHGPDNTEAAYIHSEKRWDALVDRVYKPPLITAPTFPGVLWANFLGPGHLTEFDVARLRTINAHKVKWMADDGLFVIVTPVPADTEGPEGERELRALTNQFREALKQS